MTLYILCLVIVTDFVHTIGTVKVGDNNCIDGSIQLTMTHDGVLDCASQNLNGNMRRHKHTTRSCVVTLSLPDQDPTALIYKTSCLYLFLVQSNLIYEWIIINLKESNANSVFTK